MSSLGFVVLLLILAAQLKFDQTIWGSRITPGTLVIGGYVAIAGVYCLASFFYDMLPISIYTYTVLCIFGLSALFCSFAASVVFSWRRVEMNFPKADTGKGIRLALVGTIFLYAHIIWDKVQSAGGLWSSESRDAINSGLPGHMHVFLSFLTIWYAVSTSDRKMVRYPIIVACVIAISLYPVKGWTLLPVLAVAFNESLRNQSPRAGFLPILVALIVGVVVFFGIYLMRADIDGASFDLVLDTFNDIFQHLVFYLTAGFFGLNAVINGVRLPGGIDVLFAPILNFFSYFTGDQYVNVISDTYIEGLIGHGSGGNVHSILGSPIGYIGLLGGFLLSILQVFASYVVFAMTIRSHSCAALVFGLYVLAINSIGWFEYYYWNLTFYEIASLALVMAFLQKFLVRSK